MSCPSCKEALAGRAGDITVPEGLPICSRTSLGVIAANLSPEFMWQEQLQDQSLEGIGWAPSSCLLPTGSTELARTSVLERTGALDAA